MAGPVITWDYQFSPNGQKVRNLMKMAGIPYQTCDQPIMMPRPILADLGVTYRRIPVVSIGKDMYCDSTACVDAIQSTFKDKALQTSPADHAFDVFGYRLFFQALPIVPQDFITPEFQKDREDLFPILSRPDFGSLRKSALGEMKSVMHIAETEFLGGGKGPWIGGERCSVADINAIWAIKWALQSLNVASEPGFGKDAFPRVYKWIESIPPHDDANEAEKLSGDKAKAAILAASYSAPDIGVDSNDPTGLKQGQMVAVEPTDVSNPGNNTQKGKLVGLNTKEAVLELENSLRLHFPRISYVIKEA